MKCNALTEDITRFAKKFPPNPSDWSMVDYGSAINDISGWDREMKEGSQGGGDTCEREQS